MSFEIRFTPESEETYDAVISQLRDRWGDGFVNKFELKVSKSIHTLSETPYIYPICDENTEVRRCVLHQNCSMLYRVFGESILIVCFWDNRQEPL
jgi:plasmid stabilization system protein ParE